MPRVNQRLYGELNSAQNEELVVSQAQLRKGQLTSEQWKMKEEEEARARGESKHGSLKLSGQKSHLSTSVVPPVKRGRRKSSSSKDGKRSDEDGLTKEQIAKFKSLSRGEVLTYERLERGS